jgi:predicted Fe-S protein YdhL (DUF1289 family)
MNIEQNKALEVASPCVRNCCLNEGDVCMGCYRHIDEILAWKNYRNHEKELVITSCAQRRAAAQEKLSQGKG